MLGWLALITLCLIFLLSRAPLWLSLGIAGIVALPLLGLALGSNEGRALLPLLALALSAGLFVPPSPTVQPASRVAPSRKRHKTRFSNATHQSQTGLALEVIEVPGYEVSEKVGSGGMASVYRARRKNDGQTVALKIPMEQYVADAKFIRRFHREAEVAQRLDHVNIVKTYEHGSVGVRHYMAMEYVDGRSLEAYIEAEELTADLSVDIMKAVVSALLHIHSVGIIHRDIKPQNIFIDDEGVLKLADFGISKAMEHSMEKAMSLVGTPYYLWYVL